MAVARHARANVPPGRRAGGGRPTGRRRRDVSRRHGRRRTQGRNLLPGGRVALSPGRSGRRARAILHGRSSWTRTTSRPGRTSAACWPRRGNRAGGGRVSRAPWAITPTTPTSTIISPARSTNLGRADEAEPHWRAFLACPRTALGPTRRGSDWIVEKRSFSALFARYWRDPAIPRSFRRHRRRPCKTRWIAYPSVCCAKEGFWQRTCFR